MRIDMTAQAGGEGGRFEDRRRALAFAIYTVFLLPSVGVALSLGREWGAVALLTLPVLLGARGRPRVFGAAMVAGGILLRLSFSFTGVYTDGIEAAQLAWNEVLGGLNPYGHVLAGASQSNTIYPYGPLALLAYAPGYWTEIAAAAVLLVVIARERAWLTLAFVSAFPFLVRATVNGQNDVLPCLLILLAMLSARTRTSRAVAVSAALLAVAIAVKPYAAAWAPALIGLGGFDAALVLAGVSLVLWSPVLLVWGVASFLDSERLQLTHHPDHGIALNVPILQLAAGPIALAGLFVRSWRAMFWAGLGVFLVFLYFSPWADWGYLEGIGPVAFVILETWAMERRPGREAAAGSSHTNGDAATGDGHARIPAAVTPGEVA